MASAGAPAAQRHAAVARPGWPALPVAFGVGSQRRTDGLMARFSNVSADFV